MTGPKTSMRPISAAVNRSSVSSVYGGMAAGSTRPAKAKDPDGSRRHNCGQLTDIGTTAVLYRLGGLAPLAGSASTGPLREAIGLATETCALSEVLRVSCLKM